MQYAQGIAGGIFAARLSDGEPVYEAVEALGRRESVESAFVLIVGGAPAAGRLS